MIFFGWCFSSNRKLYAILWFVVFASEGCKSESTFVRNLNGVNEDSTRNRASTLFSITSNPCPPGAILRNVKYYKDLEFDLFLSPTLGKSPVIIYIHGGAWKNGHKNEIDIHPIEKLVDRGFSLIKINYKREKQSANPYPNSAKKINCVLKMVAKYADLCQFDSNRIILGGMSAGGHLSLLYSLNPTKFIQERCAYDVQVPVVSKVFALSPLTDLSKDLAQIKEPMEEYLDGVEPSIASPISYTENLSDTSYLMIHGTADSISPIKEQGYPFYNSMLKSGQNIRQRWKFRSDHFLGLLNSEDDKKDILEDIFQFLTDDNQEINLSESHSIITNIAYPLKPGGNKNCKYKIQTLEEGEILLEVPYLGRIKTSCDRINPVYSNGSISGECRGSENSPEWENIVSTCKKG